MADSWVLLTGASAGIGYELAKCFAANGHDLVLVARNEPALDKLAGELRSSRGIQTRVIAKDLRSPTAADELFDLLRPTPVSILVNNAGFGAFGPFARTDLRLQTDMMAVNMTAPVRLTHLFLQPMLQRGSGRILNVASVAAFLPGPAAAIYFATKAFVLSFSYALSEELKRGGVTVTALCPGTTRTEFFTRAGAPGSGRGWGMDAGVVAEIGYRGLMRGKRVVIPGLMNRAAAMMAKRAPAWLSARIAAGLNQRVKP